MIVIVSILILMIQGKDPQHFEIEPINETSGLFYAHQGPIKLSNQYISLVHYYNVSYINNLLELSKQYYTQSMSFCNLIKNDASTCQLTLSMIHNQYIELTYELENINANHHPDHTRTKRGLINGVSYPINWLFGIPDADDASFYQKSIESLINDQKQTHVLMQSQIRVISDTIKNINHTMLVLNNVEYRLNSNIDTFNQYMTDSKKIINEHTLQIDLVDHLLLLRQINDIIQKQIEQYSTSITLARHGIIDYNVIAPRTLLKELQNSVKYELPLEPVWSNLEYYYKLISTKALMTDDKLIIVIKIPIVLSDSFDLYKIFPLPTQQKTNSQILSFVKNDFDYLIISRTRTKYLLLKSLTNVKEYKLGNYLCTEASTLQEGLQNSCETALFDITTTNIPKLCSINTVYAEIEIWQPISNNQWLYILSEPTRCSILCNDNQDEDVLLQKTGILTINQNCKAHSNSYSLQPKFQIFNRTIETIFPKIDITQDDCCRFQTLNTSYLQSTAMRPIKITNIDLSELKFAQHRLTQFDEQLQAQLNKPFFIQNESTILHYFKIGLSILGSSIAVYIIHKLKILSIIWFFIRKCFTNNTQNSSTEDCTTKFINCCFGNGNSVKNQIHPESKLDNFIHYDTENHEVQISSIPTYITESMEPTRRITRSTTSNSSTRPKRMITINKT